MVGGGRQEGENIPAGSSAGMEDGEGALVGRILVPRGVRILSPESENLLPVMTKGTLLLWMRILGREVLLGGWATWTQCNHKGPCEIEGGRKVSTRERAAQGLGSVVLEKGAMGQGVDGLLGWRRRERSTRSTRKGQSPVDVTFWR